MKKYFVLMAVVIGLAIYISTQDKRAAEQSAQDSARSRSKTSAATANEPISQDDIDKAKRNAPRWFAFFRWPEGAGAIALILTLLTIAEQTQATRSAAEAAARNIEIIKTKERAKIHLVISHPHPLVNKKPIAYFTVSNIGESKAYISTAFAGLHICRSDSLDGSGSGWNLLTINDSVMKDSAISNEEARWPGYKDAVYTPEMIDKKEWFIHLHGSVFFRDAFDDVWEHKFHYIWRELGGVLYLPPLGHTTGYWESQLPVCDERIKTPNRWRTRYSKAKASLQKAVKWTEELSEYE